MSYTINAHNRIVKRHCHLCGLPKGNQHFHVVCGRRSLVCKLCERKRAVHEGRIQSFGPR